MLGTQELVLILIAALVLLGPSKLPDLARSIGKATGEFKRAQLESEYELKRFTSPKGKDISTGSIVGADTDIKSNLPKEKGIDHDSDKTHLPR